MVPDTKADLLTDFSRNINLTLKDVIRFSRCQTLLLEADNWGLEQF